MYPLPPLATLASVNGAELIQVCIGASEVILHFDKRITITVMDRIVVRNEEGLDDVHQAGPDAAATLVRLLNQTIVGVQREDDHTLRLDMDSGRQLWLQDTSDQYESFWLKIEDNLYVV